MIEWQYLEHFFSRLSCSDTGKLVIPFSELGNVPLSFIQFLEKESILKKQKNALSITCQECVEICLEEVHHCPNTNQPYIDCKETGRLKIASEQLLVWELSFSSIAKKISRLCDCNGQEKAQETNKWFIGFFQGKKHKADITLELTLGKGMLLSVNGYFLPLVEVLLFQNDSLLIDLGRISQLTDKPKLFKSATTVTQEARKQKTEARNQAWRKKATQIKQNNPKLSVGQISQIIAKSELGKNVSAKTIQRQLGNLPKNN